MSKETTSFVYVTYILSTPEKVFEAITQPAIARRYCGHEKCLRLEGRIKMGACSHQ